MRCLFAAAAIVRLSAAVAQPAVLSDDAFIAAVKGGSIDEVRHFLQAGFDPNRKTRHGMALGIVCRHDSRDDYKAIAELLIESGAGFAGQSGTALHAAAACGLGDRVSRMIRAGADVNALTPEGATPLALAVNFARLEVARTLLTNGARVDQPSTDGDTPLMTAARGRTELARLLLAHGAKVNTANRTGHTALLISVGHPAFVELSRLLIEQGADIRARSLDGWTGLHGALSARNDVMARFFVEQGLDPNAATAEGWRPLHLAAAAGYTSIAMDLIDRGAEINARKSGWTPLSFALDRGWPVTAAALVARGATQ